METVNKNEEGNSKYDKSILFISKKNHELNTAIALAEAGRSAYYFKKVLLILGEIFFYLNFAGIMIFAICLPSGEIGFNKNLGEYDSIEGTYHNSQVEALMATIKIVLIFFSILPLIIAILLGSIRGKRNRFNKIYLHLTEMKKGFDEFLKGRG